MQSPLYGELELMLAPSQVNISQPVLNEYRLLIRASPSSAASSLGWMHCKQRGARLSAWKQAAGELDTRLPATSTKLSEESYDAL
jgi:hypothetical protein